MALCLTITQEAAIIRALRVTKPFTRLPHNTIWKIASLARAERLSCEHQPHELFVDMEAGSVQRLCPLLCVLVALHPLELVLILVLEAHVGEEDDFGFIVARRTHSEALTVHAAHLGRRIHHGDWPSPA